jgi:hypothetical protein
MSFLESSIDWPATRIALLLLLPTAGMALATGDEIWLRAALVTICSFIAAYRGGLTPETTALHALGIQAGWLLLWASMPFAPWFGVATALLAVIALRFVGTSERRRPIGLFLAVPAIYLSFQFNHEQPDASLDHALGDAMILLEGSMPVVVWTLLTARRPVHDMPAAEPFDPTFTWPSLLVPVGVGITAWLAVRWQVPSGHWLVWSSLVVAYGGPQASWGKFMDRAMGAAFGAPSGALAASFLQGGHVVAIVAMLAAILTLVTIRRYVVAYAVRSALIVLFITLAFEDRWIAMTRVADVVGGGVIGMTCYGIAVWLDGLTSRRQNS